MTGVAAALGMVAGAHAGLIITPNLGYSIGFNGNEGDFFSASAPANVPDNLALASNGATAFADNNSSLGVEQSLAIHFVSDLNDGVYGNADSWISDSAPAQFGGVRFAAPQAITSIAFGRDNGRDGANGDTGTNGQLEDRWQGIYTLQFTTVTSPDENTPAAAWTTIGTLDFVSADDTVLGGGFTPWFRHRFEFNSGGQPIVATGVRILVPAGGGAGGTALDEIEVYGAPVPEPAMLAALGLGALALLRRRKSD